MPIVESSEICSVFLCSMKHRLDAGYALVNCKRRAIPVSIKTQIGATYFGGYIRRGDLGLAMKNGISMYNLIRYAGAYERKT